MRKIGFLSLLCLLLFSLSACQKNPVTIGGETKDGVTVEYKYGEITFLDEVFSSKVYTDTYRENITPQVELTVSDHDVVYLYHAAVYTTDDSREILSLCRDPLCDHSKPESCIISYAPRHIIATDDNIYFAKANGIYHYSLDTLETTPFAVFNDYVIEQFLMGRFLYIKVGYNLYVKVDLETNNAVSISSNDGNVSFAEMISIEPYDGWLYYSDENGNIYRINQNFENPELLIQENHYQCFIGESYRFCDGKLYFADFNDGQYRMGIYDLTSGEVEYVNNNVYCFDISGDMIYMQLYDPIDGPEYRRSDGTVITTTANTGNRLWCAPLDDPSDVRPLATFSGENKRLDGYFTCATENYVYVYAAEFEDYDSETYLYRYSLRSGQWQRIAE